MEKDRISELSKSRIQFPQLPLDILKNFHEAFNLASSPKVQSKLPELIKQKLLFLANSIFSSDHLFTQINNKEVPVELKEFFLLKKCALPKDFEAEFIKEPIYEEYSNLMNMGLEMKLDIYIKAVIPIVPELQNLITSPNAKKGILQIKYPGTLKSWNHKFMVLEYNSKMLLIFKEIKNLTPEKELKLDGFAIRWIGKSKGKFCFSLFTQNIKPKCYNLGGEQENLVKEWYEEFRKVINPEDNTHINGNQNNQSHIKPELNKSSSDESIDDVPKDDEDYEGFKSDNDMRRVRNKKQRNKTLNSDPDDVSDPEMFPFRSTKGKPKMESVIRFQTPKGTLNPIEILGNEEDRQKSNNKELFFSTILTKDMDSPKLNESHQNVRNNNILFKSIKETEEEAGQSFDEPQELEDLRANKSKYPPIIEGLLGKVTINELTKEIGFHLVQSSGNMRLLQHDTEPLTFKVFVTLNYDLVTIISCFTDQNNYRNWNNNILDYKVVQIIEGLNSVIVHERRDFNLSFYKSRSFHYSRTMIPMLNMTRFLIIDKSVPESQSSGLGIWETLGIINYSIMAILPHPNNSKSHLLILWTQIDNQGLILTKNQNKDLTVKYLSQFANLDNFLAHRSFSSHNSKQELFGRYTFLKSQTIFPENMKNNNNMGSQLFKEAKTQDYELLFERINDDHPQRQSSTEKPMNEPSKNKSSVIEKSLMENPPHNEETIKEEEEESKSTSVDKILPKKPYSPLGLQSSATLLELLRTNQHTIQTLKHHYKLYPMNISEDQTHLQPIDQENGGHYAINKDWSRAKEGGMLWYNKKELEVQGKVLTYLIKRLGSNLIQGKSVINISLPVDLFDTKSFLERIAYSYTYAPYFLEPHPKNLDPKSSDFERPGLYHIYQVVCFILSSLHMSISQKKPFNPILGETFQGWIRGCPISCEQISHHPPISSFYMLGHHFKIQGNFEIAASMNPNTVTGKQLGLGQVIFNERTENEKRIYFTFPPCVVSGLAFGSRVVNYEGKVWVFDAKERLAMELAFNPDKKGMISGLLSKQKTANDYFKGVVYEMKEAGIDKMMKGLLIKKYTGINFKEDVINNSEISVCEGIWHDYMEIKGKKYWERNDYIAYQLEYEEKPLPSDCLYREDLIVWRSHDLEEAQKTKEKMEVFQRNDKKLREKVRGKNH